MSLLHCAVCVLTSLCCVMLGFGLVGLTSSLPGPAAVMACDEVVLTPSEWIGRRKGRCIPGMPGAEREDVKSRTVRKEGVDAYGYKHGRCKRIRLI